MKRVRRWMFAVLPPLPWIVGFVLLYVASELPYVVALVKHGDANPRLHRVRDGLLVIASSLYAGWRILWTHPFFDRDHRKWLEATPWTAARSLPVGPVHLVPQDVILIAMLTAPLAFEPTIDPIGPAVCFLIAYVLCLAASFPQTGQGRFVYGVLFGVGAMIRFGEAPLLMLGCGLATYLVAWIGLKRSLAAFPWDLPEASLGEMMKNSARESLAMSQQMVGRELLGWPYDRLTPKPNEFRIHLLDGALISFLVGWWIYVVSWHGFEAGMRPLAVVALHVMSGGLVGALAFTRIVLYTGCRWPPIGLVGRLLTFRWIIPRYDRVWLVPLSGVVLVFAIGWVVRTAGGLPLAVAAAIPAPPGLLVVLCARPTFLEWQLLGHHRLVPGFNQATDEVVEL